MQRRERHHTRTDAEIGMLTESVTAFTVNFAGSDTLQDNYLADLLAHADARGAETHCVSLSVVVLTRMCCGRIPGCMMGLVIAGRRIRAEWVNTLGVRATAVPLTPSPSGTPTGM